MSMLWNIIKFPLCIVLYYYGCVIVFGGIASLIFWDISFITYPATHITGWDINNATVGQLVVQSLSRVFGVLFGIALASIDNESIL